MSGDVDALRSLAVAAAEQAGAELRRWFGRTGAADTKSSSVDYVSEADRVSEALLVARLRAERPDDAVHGEEGSDEAGGSGLRWIVDPLDGTVNFVYGRRPWTVSVACADADGELVGAVHDPMAGETFAAARGRGATLGGVALRCNDPVALPQALVTTGFAYDRAHRAEQGALVARIVGRVGNLRRSGSAALDLCEVACGRVDAYYEEHLGAWDSAAGGLIAAEAGAALRPYGRGGLLAAGPALADELLALIAGG